MIDTVVYEYEGNVIPNDERQELFAKSLQMWLRPYSEEINHQKGKLVLCFSPDGTNGFRLENVNVDLWERVLKLFPAFVKPG